MESWGGGGGREGEWRGGGLFLRQHCQSPPERLFALDWDLPNSREFASSSVHL